LFVDYAGHTAPIVNQHTGEFREAQIFIAVLGASNYTYAEATWTQSLSDWIGSHQRTFTFLGGVVEIVVPDNLKSGVHKASLCLNCWRNNAGICWRYSRIDMTVARPS
jgi:transposase